MKGRDTLVVGDYDTWAHDLRNQTHHAHPHCHHQEIASTASGAFENSSTRREGFNPLIQHCQYHRRGLGGGSVSMSSSSAGASAFELAANMQGRELERSNSTRSRRSGKGVLVMIR